MFFYSFYGGFIFEVFSFLALKFTFLFVFMMMSLGVNLGVSIFLNRDAIFQTKTFVIYAITYEFFFPRFACKVAEFSDIQLSLYFPRKIFFAHFQSESFSGSYIQPKFLTTLPFKDSVP